MRAWVASQPLYTVQLASQPLYMVQLASQPLYRVQLQGQLEGVFTLCGTAVTFVN